MVAAACVIALAIVGGGVRAAGAATTAAAPNLAQIALGPADVPGAKVASQKYVKSPETVASYTREFKQGSPIGRRVTLLFENDVDAYATAAAAHVDFVALKKLFGSKAGHALLTASIVGDAKKDTKKKGSTKVTFGRVQSLGAGAETFLLPLTLSLNGIRFPLSISVTRADRIESSLYVMGFPGAPIPPAEIARLQRIVEGHVKTALTPLNTVLPTVTGTAVVGQVLTGTDGTWTNEPTTFTRAWLRCDAAGANCLPIAGATASTYTVLPEDGGLTIRFSVTVTNASASSQPAVSVQAAIPAVAVPPSA